MIKVKLNNNVGEREVITDVNTTVRTFLADNAVDTNSCLVNIDSCMLAPGDMNKTFAQLGIEPGAECTMFAIVKTHNA